MSSSLLMTRRFAPLFWTQFFSAFSDNFLKNALVFLILFHIGGQSPEGRQTAEALLLFGVIGSLFGPIKYGILPDHLARSELPAGNALVEGATFIAILLGTIVGGLAAKDGGDPATFSGLVMVFALMCWGASLLIPRTGEAAPNLIISPNIVASTIALLKDLKS